MLITAEELINESVDEKSVMTYLAQFPQATYKPPMGIVQGFHQEAFVGQPFQFTVRATNENAKLTEALIRDPNGNLIEPIVSYDQPNRTYTVQYIPHVTGPYQVG
ncbi:unnamed protein product [Anisakis simplex]|uniref:Filamin-A n=1 Tax=Anisakis simplex TaxID=6269 RepID=A0A0M3JH50_ANISI|nr:unnamed protein product [Anisakis simplex]